MTVTLLSTTVNEQIPFRLFQTPCCGKLLCWVMPKYPTYCPHCGTPAANMRFRGSEAIIDNEAWLRRRAA